MPVAPYNALCSHLGCKNPRSKFNSLCVEHGGRDTQRFYSNDERKAAKTLYDTTAWKRKRIVELSRHPMCAACLCDGRYTPATEVDHVFAWRHIGKEAFLANAFQSLCHDHHSMKTQQEKRGVYLHWVNGVQYERTLGDYKMFTVFGN